MKWGNLYTADYVNVLHNATKKNLDGEFRFICLTDSPKGICKDIEVYPIPDIGCTASMWENGGWPKLSVFKEDLYGLEGRALFIDLDTIIWGKLDKFFSRDGDFIAIDTGPNWRPGGEAGKTHGTTGTGVFAFNIGEQIEILKTFKEDPENAVSSSRLEQVWVQKKATTMTYWPSQWVISFKRWLRQPIGIDIIRSPKKPDAGVSIIAFHGDPRPQKLITSRAFEPWDKFPHMGNGPVEWLRKYWAENGGEV